PTSNRSGCRLTTPRSPAPCPRPFVARLRSWKAASETGRGANAAAGEERDRDRRVPPVRLVFGMQALPIRMPPCTGGTPLSHLRLLISPNANTGTFSRPKRRATTAWARAPAPASGHDSRGPRLGAGRPLLHPAAGLDRSADRVQPDDAERTASRHVSHGSAGPHHPLQLLR